VGPVGSPAIVVLWTGYRAGPWACRSLRAAGWRVIGVHPDDEGRGRSTACPRPRPCPSPSAEPEALVAALQQLCREEGALAVLPINEEPVRILAELAPDLSPAVVVGPDAHQFRAVCDKSELTATAAAAGVGRPRSVTVGPDGPEGSWPPLPSVVKVRTSSAIEEPAGFPVTVRDERERALAVSLLAAAGIDAVVEELLTDTQWTVHCVRGDGGQFAALPARILRSFPRNVGMPSLFQGDHGNPQAVDAARRMLDVIDYRGPANVQLFERDGEMLVHDVNLRVPASVALAMAAGLDVPALGVDAGLGRPLSLTSLTLRQDVRYVSLVDELRAMRSSSEPRPGQVMRELVEAAVSRSAVLDPPLYDPLWASQRMASASRDRIRRVVRAALPSRA
jgi:carbamoyl-phosphate synthase large subunit